MVVAVLSGYAILDAYIGDYMKGMADYVLQWFPAFFLGAVLALLPQTKEFITEDGLSGVLTLKLECDTKSRN